MRVGWKEGCGSWGGHGIPEASVPLLEFCINGLGRCGPVWEWIELVVVLAGCVCWGDGGQDGCLGNVLR